MQWKPVLPQGLSPCWCWGRGQGLRDTLTRGAQPVPAAQQVCPTSCQNVAARNCSPHLPLWGSTTCLLGHLHTPEPRGRTGSAHTGLAALGRAMLQSVHPYPPACLSVGLHLASHLPKQEVTGLYLCSALKCPGVYQQLCWGLLLEVPKEAVGTCFLLDFLGSTNTPWQRPRLPLLFRGKISGWAAPEMGEHDFPNVL